MENEEYIFEELPDNNLDNDTEDEENDILCCQICLGRMGSKEHFVVALPCGHVFGKSCTTTWFSFGWEYCPVCKEKANAEDVITLYIDVSFAEEYQRLKEISDDLEIMNGILIDEKERVKFENAKLVVEVDEQKKKIEDLEIDLAVLHAELNYNKQIKI